jgi:hypothetical protein
MRRAGIGTKTGGRLSQRLMQMLHAVRLCIYITPLYVHTHFCYLFMLTFMPSSLRTPINSAAIPNTLAFNAHAQLHFNARATGTHEQKPVSPLMAPAPPSFQ